MAAPQPPEPTESATPAPETPSSSGRGLTRRQLAAGVAWSVPTIAFAGAAPAFAASPMRTVTVVTTASGVQGVPNTIPIPANATNITFEVIGGGGGAGPDNHFADSGGSGAKITGQLDLGGKPTTLWVVAGGGGSGPAARGAGAITATGFGNGGPSEDAGKPNPVPVESAELWGMGGGAGSAIALASAPNAGGTLLVAAGGGGAAARMGHSRDSDPNFSRSPNEGYSGGSGGQASGGAGADFVVTTVLGTITGSGGLGALGATGGAASPAGSTAISAGKYRKTNSAAGASGGNATTGNFGGGDGGRPVVITTADRFLVTHGLRLASAGGGGGYAGGGSSGAFHVSALDFFPPNLLIKYDGIFGVVGGGGAGSNFVAGTVAGATVLRPVQTSAGNGGTKASNAGGTGRVTISYDVPL